MSRVGCKSMAQRFDQAVDFGDALALIGAGVRRQAQHLGNFGTQDGLEQPSLSGFSRHRMALRGRIVRRNVARVSW
jgi:hypothetical protein